MEAVKQKCRMCGKQYSVDDYPDNLTESDLWYPIHHSICLACDTARKERMENADVGDYVLGFDDPTKKYRIVRLKTERVQETELSMKITHKTIGYYLDCGCYHESSFGKGYAELFLDVVKGIERG